MNHHSPEPVARRDSREEWNELLYVPRAKGAMDLSLTFLMPPRYLHTSPWGRQGKGKRLTFNGHGTTRHDTTRHDLSRLIINACTPYVCSVHRRVTSMILCIHQPAGFSTFKPQRQALDEQHRFERRVTQIVTSLLLIKVTKLGASPPAPWLRNT